MLADVMYPFIVLLVLSWSVFHCYTALVLSWVNSTRRLRDKRLATVALAEKKEKNRYVSRHDTVFDTVLYYPIRSRLMLVVSCL